MKPLYEKTRDIVQDMNAIQHMKELNRWLLPPDPSVNYNKALQQRHKGSGQWLLQRTDYATWKAKAGSFLWLHGIPGCGKTVLSSSIIEDLRHGVICHDPLYFYFDFSDTNKQALDKALRSLIVQLYRHSNSEDVQRPLNDLWKAHGEGMAQPDLDALSKTFQRMIQLGNGVWIILDALDECQPRTKLLQWIKILMDSQKSKVHLLVTSRPEQDIESAITRWAYKESIVRIRSTLIADDIQAYILARVREHAGLNRWQSHPEIQQEIGDTLTNKADGMFRWVSCQLDALEGCYHYSTLKTALESLPEDLNETYARILAKIPRSHAQYTTRILQFLTFSERPLRLDEAVDLIAVEIEKSPRFDPKNRMPLPEEVLRYCSSLATMVSKKDFYNTDQPEIRLAHSSVKEYLRSTELGSIVARGSIAKICLSYLLEVPHKLETWQIPRVFPLAEYAAQNWTGHAAAAQRDENQHMAVHALTMELFRSAGSYEIFYGLCSPRDEWRGPPNEVGAVRPPLYYAAMQGLSNSVLELIPDIDVPSRLFSNSLYSASRRGHDKVVQILLERNDVNGVYLATSSAIFSVGTKCECHSEALYVASQKGHEKVVRLLLSKGADADANAENGGFGNALQIASKKGHKGVVALLLQYGANVHAKDGEHGNALYAASWHGHEEIVELLLTKGATVNPEDKYLGTSLRAASAAGATAVVSLLLRIGAYDNIKGGYHGSALCAASCAGHKEIVRMLLDKSTNIHDQNYYDEALHAAAGGDHEEIFYMLFVRGANFFQGINFNGTSLSKEDTWKLSQWLYTAEPVDERIQTYPRQPLPLSHQSMMQLLPFDEK